MKPNPQPQMTAMLFQLRGDALALVYTRYRAPEIFTSPFVRIRTDSMPTGQTLARLPDHLAVSSWPFPGRGDWEERGVCDAGQLWWRC